MGFGFQKSKEGNWEQIHHIGSVIIKDFVSIGDNSCVDRGVLTNTIIGEYTKIDNLVQVGHNVKIGKNSLIISNVVLCGRVEIGDNVLVAPATVVGKGLKIADGTHIGYASLGDRNTMENEKNNYCYWS